MSCALGTQTRGDEAYHAQSDAVFADDSTFDEMWVPRESDLGFDIFGYDEVPFQFTLLPLLAESAGKSCTCAVLNTSQV